MRANELTEGRGGVLYHSMMSEYIEATLSENRILGTSIHRYNDSGKLIFDPELHGNWLTSKDGKIPHHWYQDRKDTLADPDVPERAKRNIRDWEGSNWYVGVSLTRSPKFAGGWKEIILELDHALLAQRYRIVAKAWGSSRREAEEFLILKDNAREYVESGEYRRISSKTPRIAPLSKYLTGLYLPKREERKIQLRPEGAEPEQELVMNHPMFKGFL